MTVVNLKLIDFIGFCVLCLKPKVYAFTIIIKCSFQTSSTAKARNMIV